MSTRRVITRTHLPDSINSGDFSFTPELIPALSKNWNGATYLKNYRQKAWDSYKKISLPTTKEEAWRRTDIHNLNAGIFSIPESQSFSKLASIPKYLLKPLVSKRHGGQIIIRPERTDVKVDESLNQKGIIFTDLHTAEMKYADKLENIIGQIVKPDDGKFASLAAAMGKIWSFYLYS